MLEHLRTQDAELFRQLGVACQHLTRSTRLLEEMLGGAGGDEGGHVRAIQESDRAAHDVAREADTRAFRAFLLGVDRMELHAFVAALDATVAAVDRTALHAAALRAAHAPEPLRALAAQLTRAAVALEVAVPHVRDAPADAELRTGEVRRAAVAGQVAFEAGLAALFSGAPVAVDVVRWKDLYERIRDALARCAEAASALHALTDHATA